MSASAVIAMRRRRLIRRFREAGAVDEQHAAEFESLGQRRSWIFDQMVNHRVFLRTAEGRFYLDERAAAAFLRARKIRALVGAALTLLLFFLAWGLVVLMKGR